MKSLEIEGCFRIKVFVDKFSRCCWSSSSGGMMLIPKRKMGLLAITVEKIGGSGGCGIQMEIQNGFHKLEKGGSEWVGVHH